MKVDALPKNKVIRFNWTVYALKLLTFVNTAIGEKMCRN